MIPKEIKNTYEVEELRNVADNRLAEGGMTSLRQRCSQWQDQVNSVFRMSQRVFEYICMPAC